MQPANRPTLPSRPCPPEDDYADADYWSQAFAAEPYYRAGDTYDDFAAAYETGYRGHQRYREQGFAGAEARLRHEWEAARGISRLDWARARLAVQRAWERSAAGGANPD